MSILDFDANKHGVEAVTVFYQSDRAEITRKIVVQLADGQNTIEVKNLPSSIDENSIRVDGTGNATIFDVVYHRPPKIESRQQEAQLRDLHTQQNEIRAEADILTHQSGLLNDYSKTMTGKDTDVKHLETFLDFYASRKGQINKEKARLDKVINTMECELSQKSKDLDADEESIRKRGVRVSIVVLAGGAGEANISLTYMVSGASWTPQYDLRADIAQDEKSQSSVNLHYRAAILQTTGEDWSNVSLTISTAMPLRGSEVPSLEPCYISIKRRPSIAMKRASRAAPGSMRGALLGDSPLSAPSLPPPPAFLQTRSTKAVQGALSSTFVISGLSSIPSESNDEQKTHTVSIVELYLDSVELEWITVPKLQATAFLRCKVQNTSEYELLPGNASVFVNGSFVAKSSVTNVSPKEKFECSLGADPAVRVTYHPQSKKIKSAGSLLSAKTTTSIMEQKITIKNTCLSRIPRLRISEQVPVPRNDKMKVTLLEPSSLAQSSGKSVVQDGVQVRWMNPNDALDEGEGNVPDGEVDIEGAQGLFEWVCEVGPGKSVDMTLAWSVTATVDVDWTMS